MNIAGFDTQERVLVVAEVGNNHEGSRVQAERMIDLAASAGADAVKFQTIVPERLVSSLQIERIQQLSRFALSQADFVHLAQVAEQHGVLFLSTPFDLDSARFLNDLVPAFKVASGDNTFFPLLDLLAGFGKPLLVSTGLCDLPRLAGIRDFIVQTWEKRGMTPFQDGADLAFLHCVTSYPTPPEEASLLAIRDLATLGVTPGYSDHTLGIDAAVLSVALGARIIEKHFTLDKQFSDFRDHQLSADPQDLAQLVDRVRLAEKMLGRGKAVQPCEQALAVAARRSIVAARDLPAELTLTWADLDWTRPGGGLAPGNEALLLGRVLRQAKRAGEMILRDDLIEAG